MKIKRTKSQFQQFKKYCNQWINNLGLSDWHIEVLQREIETQSTTIYDIKARHACISLPNAFEADYCVIDDLNRLALHEVLHIALADIIHEANTVKDIDDVIHTEHALINKLMRVIK